MPAFQRGQVFRQNTGWAYRYYDATGKRHQKGRFPTKSTASRALDVKLAENLNGPARRVLTVAELVEEFLDQHVAEPGTLRNLDHRLRRLTREFQDKRVDQLTVAELGSWRKRLPERSAWNYTKAMRQVLAYAVNAGYVAENLGKRVPNPEPKRPEVPTFMPDELVALAEELGSPLPLIVAGTGPRPEEWVPFERSDLDRTSGILSVRRVYVEGKIRAYGKTRNSVPRQIPLSAGTLAAFDQLTPRLDTPILFPGVRGRYLNYPEWRQDVWKPALRAAGIEYRVPYAMRHTFAANCIAAGIPTFEIARHMGTSVSQIEKTYGHLLPDSIDRARAALAAFEARQEAEADAR